jgi:hypothetical protein
MIWPHVPFEHVTLSQHGFAASHAWPYVEQPWGGAGVANEE